MNAKHLILVLGAACILIIGCAPSTTVRDNLPPLTTVPRVDLSRYMGTWFDIASFPQSFQKGCHASTATYTLRDDGLVTVVNRCRKGGLDGPWDQATGVARVTDPATGARLKVSFFRPFWGDYWIIDLDPEYRYAVVGHPSRDYLWILSRTPSIDPAVYQRIIERLKALRYPVERLRQTPQPPPG